MWHYNSILGHAQGNSYQVALAPTSSHCGDMSRYTVRVDNINPRILQCRYDVRGEIYLAAVKRAEQGKEVIYTNVGNPHAVGQKPLTFGRQVMALLMAPFLFEDPEALKLFPPDAVARAKLYQSKLKGGEEEEKKKIHYPLC